jgi:hypothetical protein
MGKDIKECKKVVNNLKRILYGNADEGLKDQITLNTKFRIGMEQTIKQIERKLLWILLAVIFWQVLSGIVGHSDKILQMIR